MGVGSGGGRRNVWKGYLKETRKRKDYTLKRRMTEHEN